MIPFCLINAILYLFRFLAFANAVVSACCLVSLVLVFLLHLQGSNPNHYFFLFLHDLVCMLKNWFYYDEYISQALSLTWLSCWVLQFMMCLVLGGCSAATAIGFVGQYGNSHTGWTPICDHFGKFCHRVSKSVILSYLSVISLLILVISSAIKSRQIQV